MYKILLTHHKPSPSQAKVITSIAHFMGRCLPIVLTIQFCFVRFLNYTVWYHWGHTLGTAKCVWREVGKSLEYITPKLCPREF